ncbi:hypothetical protein E2C01_011029 [Portunus trituberculatus]|uniref:Uncharacterized protein n=1 Tax=Portunus trituberculatus TaxID=210409 RepID=A0A5B7DAB1_PORTR|nr:hypothetical protein [Portunus trituberculatus]
MARNVALTRQIVLASTNTYTKASDHNKSITCTRELARQRYSDTKHCCMERDERENSPRLK